MIIATVIFAIAGHFRYADAIDFHCHYALIDIIDVTCSPLLFLFMPLLRYAISYILHIDAIAIAIITPLLILLSLIVITLSFIGHIAVIDCITSDWYFIATHYELPPLLADGHYIITVIAGHYAINITTHDYYVDFRLRQYYCHYWYWLFSPLIVIAFAIDSLRHFHIFTARPRRHMDFTPLISLAIIAGYTYFLPPYYAFRQAADKLLPSCWSLRHWWYADGHYRPLPQSRCFRPLLIPAAVGWYIGQSLPMAYDTAGWQIPYWYASFSQLIRQLLRHLHYCLRHILFRFAFINTNITDTIANTLAYFFIAVLFWYCIIDWFFFSPAIGWYAYFLADTPCFSPFSQLYFHWYWLRCHCRQIRPLLDAFRRWPFYADYWYISILISFSRRRYASHITLLAIIDIADYFINITVYFIARHYYFRLWLLLLRHYWLSLFDRLSLILLFFRRHITLLFSLSFSSRR